MIVTRPYRRLKCLLSLLSGPSASAPPIELLEEVAHLYRSGEITMLIDTDSELVGTILSQLEENPHLAAHLGILRELAALPTYSTLFERQVQELLKEVRFAETYGYDAIEPFGRELFDSHLRGLELVHEEEMTPRAYADLAAFLDRFETYVEGLNLSFGPFDIDSISDDLVRLETLVGGY